jgi:ABC-type nitrate/sulfonate/bicarbonate transport system permease component
VTSLTIAYLILGGLGVASVAATVIGVLMDRFTARQRATCPHCQAAT